MRKFIIGLLCISLAILVGSQVAKAQSYKVEGKTITVVKQSGVSSNDIKTDFTFKDSKGVEYPIYLHKATKGEHEGMYSAYVVKTSSKTGNEYKAFIPTPSETYSLGEQLAKQLGLTK